MRVRSRVVVDGNLVTAGGVTAGLDAALVVASLLRADAIAQEFQLSIPYAPNPVFHSGTPEQVPLRFCKHSIKAIQQSRHRGKPKRGGSRRFWANACAARNRMILYLPGKMAAVLPNRGRIGILCVSGPALESGRPGNGLMAKLPLTTKGCKCMTFVGVR